MRLLFWLEPLWLINLTLVIMFPSRLLPDGGLPIVVLALFAFWPLNFLVERRLLPPAPLHLALAVLLLWLPVNLWAAVDSGVAWEAASYLLLGVAFYGAAMRWPLFQSRPALLAWLLIAFAVLLALAGPLIAVQERAWPLIGALQQRAAPIAARLGETINPNILAGVLVVVLPLAVAMALAAAEPGVIARRMAIVRRLLLLASSALLLAVIVLSGSRGAQLAAGASLLVVLALRWPRLLWAAPIVGLAAAGAVFWIGPSTLLDQIGTGGAVGGLDERMEIWSRAIYALQDFAFTGVGLGHFNRVIPLLYPYFLIAPSVDIPHAHNVLLQVGVDLGFPGLIAWLAILLAVTALLIATWRRSGGVTRALAAGVLGALVAMLVHGQLDAALWGTRLAFVPWLLFALAVLTADRNAPIEQ